MEEAAGQPANASRQLATDQIERLNAIGAFIDHGDAGIAHELLHAPFGDIAVAAVNLLRHRRALIAEIGHIGLHHRGEEGNQVVGFLAPLGRRMLGGDIELDAGPQRQGAAALNEGLDGH